MKTTILFSGKTLFVKIALLTALVLGGGNFAWGDGLDDIDSSLGRKTIGTTYNDASFRAPICTNNKASQSETIYTSSEIGLDNGTKIVALTFRGYRTSNSASFNIKVWMENTSDAACTSTTSTFVTPDDNNLVYNSSYTIPKIGNTPSSNYADVMTIILDEDFEYTGGNLRVIMQCETSSTSLTYFEKTNTTRTYCRTASSVASLGTASSTQNPVLYAIYKKDPSTFSGVFAIKKIDGDTAPIEGATLTLTNGDFVYSGTTTADGSFSIDVKKDDRTYTLTTDYDEKKYAPFDNQITFETSNIEKDVLLEEVDYFYVNNISVPTGIVNNTLSVSADATNYSGDDISADSYTATLFIGGETVSTANPIAILNEKTNKYTFQFVPHTLGEQTAYIVFTNGVKSSQSDNFTIKIEDEFGGGDVQILDFTSNNFYSPIYTSIKHNYSSTVYTSEILGLPAGARITNFSFKSRKTASTELDQHVRIWIENTTDANTVKKEDPSEMTLIFETNKVGGHGSYTTYTNYFSADLSANPFVYTGKNLRVVVQSERTSTSDFYVYFQLDESYKATYDKYKDLESGVGDEIRDESWKSTAQMSPVLYLTVANSYNISGTITDDSSSPIASATVKAQSGDVYYTTTTNSDGEYELPVVQIDKTYTLTIEATGMVKYTEDNVSLTSDIVRDIELSDKERQVVTTAGMATFVSDYDLDYSSVEGLKAYKAKVDGTNVGLTQVTTVPAGEGVLLMATSVLDENTTFNIPQASESLGSWADSDNDFIRGAGNTLASTDGSYNYYILNKVGGVVNFYRANSQKVGTNRAYLRTPVEVSPSRLSFVFDENSTTGIKNVSTNKNVKTRFYNLQGQRMLNPRKGVYITEERKVVIN